MLQKYQDVTRRDAAETVAMTIVRQEKTPGKDARMVEKTISFEENIHFEEFPVLNESEEILVLVDEAHCSHTRTLHRDLRKALPNAAIIGFTGTPILRKEKTETREIFGEFIDKYLLQDAELDGATVPILYEGRTADGLVKDASGLDQLFEDLFRDYTPDELAMIKAKYATAGDVLEAPLLIEQKARDMLRHYVSVVLPEGYKAQVVATSRQAAVTYREKLEQARQQLVAELAALPHTLLSLPEDEIEQLDTSTRFPVRTYGELGKLRTLEIAAVISGDHNAPRSRGGTGPTSISRRSVFLFFNWRLLQLPVRLIDYVIVHEPVHIQEPHHSSEFWQAIDRALPAWQQLKDALRSDGTRFLVFGMNTLPSL